MKVLAELEAICKKIKAIFSSCMDIPEVQEAAQAIENALEQSAADVLTKATSDAVNKVTDAANKLADKL